jgi:hypothetical protein
MMTLAFIRAPRKTFCRALAVREDQIVRRL